MTDAPARRLQRDGAGPGAVPARRTPGASPATPQNLLEDVGLPPGRDGLLSGGTTTRCGAPSRSPRRDARVAAVTAAGSRWWPGCCASPRTPSGTTAYPGGRPRRHPHEGARRRPRRDPAPGARHRQRRGGWGRMHLLGLHSQSGIGPVEWLFNRDGWKIGGGGSIVNATGWDAAEGYEVTSARGCGWSSRSPTSEPDRCLGPTRSTRTSPTRPTCTSTAAPAGPGRGPRSTPQAPTPSPSSPPPTDPQDCIPGEEGDAGGGGGRPDGGVVSWGTRPGARRRRHAQVKAPNGTGQGPGGRTRRRAHPGAVDTRGRAPDTPATASTPSLGAPAPAARARPVPAARPGTPGGCRVRTGSPACRPRRAHGAGLRPSRRTPPRWPRGSGCASRWAAIARAASPTSSSERRARAVTEGPVAER